MGLREDLLGRHKLALQAVDERAADPLAARAQPGGAGELARLAHGLLRPGGDL